MTRYLMLLPIALTACAGTTPPPAVEVRTVVKTVEIQRPCPITTPVRPAPLARPLPTDAVKLLALVAAKLVEYSGAGGYADRADAAIELCVKR